MHFKKILLLSSIIFVSSYAQDKSDIIINSLHQDKDTLSYSVVGKEKLLFESDSTIYKYDVVLIKNGLDSIYGYDIKIVNTESIFYHKNNISYNFYPSNQSYISNSKRNESLSSYILPLHKINKEDFVDTLNIFAENEKHVIFIKKHKNQQGVSGIKEKFVVSKKSKNLILNTLMLDFQNSTQYTEIQYGKIKFNIKSDITKELDSLKIIYQPFRKPDKIIKELEINSINTISGILIGSDIETKISEFKQDYLLLDFWYTGCYPCIKSFPTLIDIKNNYLNKSFEIIGINTLDNIRKNKKQLNDFIINNNLNYPNILSSMTINYLNAYPTVVVLNKKREIIYSHIGYNKDNEDSLIKFLEDLF